MSAINPLRGEAALTVAGKDYKLTFDANAFCYAQEALGLKALEMVTAFSSDPDNLIIARGLLWAGMQKHHACHILEAGEILSDAGQPAVRDALSAALAAAFGLAEKTDAGDKEPGKAPTKTRGTGKGFTGSTARRAVKAKPSGASLPA